MTVSKKEVLIHVDAGLLKKIDTYCNDYSLSEEDLIEGALGEYLVSREKELNSLINGYVEMAHLNSEICEEFTACESEAYSHIR